MPALTSPTEILPGVMKAFDLQGTAVGVANVDGKFYGFSNTCPHHSCSLAMGRIEGMVITCAVDGSQFDLASGHVISGPATGRIRTYRVQLEGDELRI